MENIWSFIFISSFFILLFRLIYKNILLYILISIDWVYEVCMSVSLIVSLISYNLLSILPGWIPSWVVRSLAFWPEFKSHHVLFSGWLILYNIGTRVTNLSVPENNTMGWPKLFRVNKQSAITSNSIYNWARNINKIYELNN